MQKQEAVRCYFEDVEFFAVPVYRDIAGAGYRCQGIIFRLLFIIPVRGIRAGPERDEEVW
jgi:hypothetical protein